MKTNFAHYVIMFKTGQLTLFDVRGISVPFSPLTPKFMKKVHSASKDDDMMWADTYPTEIMNQAYANTQRDWKKQDFKTLNSQYRKSRRDLVSQFNDEYDMSIYAN